MEEYNRIKIQHICSNICSGGTPKSTVTEYYGGNIPWLNTKEINFNQIYKTEKTITNEGLNNSSAKWIPAKSVIVAMYGATAGKAAINQIPLTTNQACCNLMINPTKADYRFVYYALCNDYTYLASLANGGAQQNLNAQQIKEFAIPFPSLEGQKRIANILSSLDDKIELNRRINENLEQQAQALFKSWFVDFEPFKDGKFVDSELGMIPEGWRVGTLEEIGQIIGGGTPSKANSSFYCENGIPWITPKDLSINKSKYISRGENDITEIGYRNSSAKKIPAGSVLFSSRAPIGYIAIANNEVTTNQGFKSVIPTKAGTCFIYLFLQLYKKYIESLATGSTFKEASGALMKSLKLKIPPQSIFENFEFMLNPLFSQQCVLESEIDHLSKLRDTLLPRLMSGELAITDVDDRSIFQ